MTIPGIGCSVSSNIDGDDMQQINLNHYLMSLIFQQGLRISEESGSDEATEVHLWSTHNISI